MHLWGKGATCQARLSLFVCRGQIFITQSTMTTNHKNKPQPKPILLPNWSLRQLVGGTLVVVAVAAAFWLIIRFYELIFLLIVAIIIGIVMKPAILWLQKRGVPRSVGVLIVYSLILIPFLILIWLSAPLLIEQTARIVQSLGESYSIVYQRMLGSPSLMMRRIAAELPFEIGMAVSPVPDDSQTEASTSELASMWASSTLVLRSVAAALTLCAMTFYWTVESERLQKMILLLIPMAHRQELQELGQAIEVKLSRYLVGQLILCLAIGVLSFVVYLALGLPNALLLAVFAGLMEAVPNIGPIIGAVPAVIMAFSVSPTTALAVLVASGLIQLAENYLLVPRIMGEAIGVRPLVILLAWLAFSSFFGVAGAIVAIPLGVVIQLVVERALLRPGALQERSSGGRDHISVLRYEISALVSDVRQQIRHKEDVADASNDQMEDSIEAIAMDLDSVLAQYDEGTE